MDPSNFMSTPGKCTGSSASVLFINDLELNCNAEVVLKFADDTKVGQQIQSDEDRETLKRSLDHMINKSATWGMKFNITKCQMLHLGRDNPSYQYI